MVVLAACICTRGGKPVLSRQFRDMPRSRIEGLLAAFPKLTDAGTQHTTVETETVRYVYQPLEELYMVLITNKQSNILQDIDSLHLFAQITQSICRTTDEREILRNAFELLGAFDEAVALGYKENLTLSQVKTFMEMESHEERIQEIISRNKEFEASEERKRKAKQLDIQRKELAKSGRGSAPRTPQYPIYQSPQTQIRSPATPAFDTYEAEKKKTFTAAPKGKGMQLGKKSKATNIFEKVRNELGASAEETAPLVATPSHSAASASQPIANEFAHPISVVINETISAEVSREGVVKSYEVKGDLQLSISDPSLNKIKLAVTAEESNGVQFKTHPNVDKNLFTSSKVIQAKDANRPFPANGNALGVLRWRQASKPGVAEDSSVLPLTFVVWVNSANNHYSITIEYELTNPEDRLQDVVISIPYQTSEPVINSPDEVYEVTEDSVDWNVKFINAENTSGSFEFEAQAVEQNEFFPMEVRFRKETPFINVDVSTVNLTELNEEVDFHKEVRCVASGYTIT
ncbi:Longin-like protein [Terfezia boudieri ATCC MYA-4762]|uniref:Coatomer subunit delta n=1 Tax=Terfezia boudieri ATCC MYA-4762 TaxID=1051890 RepID=A0A3N4LB22_9PEZI|nr:Longin-like protein [Terfezia boudieri ATCC MYA-4762]